MKEKTFLLKAAIKAIVLIVIFIYVDITYAQSFAYDLNKIDPVLMTEIENSTKSNQLYPILVVMSEQYNHDAMEQNTRNMNNQTAREYVINEMKRFTGEMQVDVVYVMHNQKKEMVENFKAFWIINGFACEATSEVVGMLSQRDDIKMIYTDKKHKMLPEIWDTHSVQSPIRGNTWNVEKVNAPSVWTYYGTSGYTGDGVIVAVIDSGVNYNHTDIADNMWDGGGTYPYHGYDFVNNDNDPLDDHGHGTHCAGTVAGNGSSGTQTGIAPEAKIMALKVLDNEGDGSDGDILDAMQFALDNGADVLSMSLGASGVGGYWAYRDALVTMLHAGVVATIAAGNDGDELDEYPVPYNIGAPGNCPPPYLHPDQANILSGGLSATITVGATNQYDQKTNFSSIGPATWSEGDYVGYYHDYPYNISSVNEIGLIKPDVSAPGYQITSLTYDNNTGYCDKNGTSMATPCVAGIIALMLEADPDLKPGDIDMILETTAVRCEGAIQKNNRTGSGRVDAYAAIQTIKGGCFAPTNLSASLSGRTVTLSWTAVEGVSSYRIYRNDDLIASNVTGTSYTDSSLEIGEYEYFLRSNCSDGSISSVSNTANITVPYQGEVYVTIGDLHYCLNEQELTAKVSGHKNGNMASGDIMIPSMVGYTNIYGQPHIYIVTTIGWRAFDDCSGLTSVTIPNSVTTIESHAFSGCGGLTSVTIPYSLTTIEYNAFDNCSGLTTVYWNAVNATECDNNFNESPFYNCHNLITVVFGDSVESIPAYVFKGCSGLNSLTIGNSVTTICECAFSGCSGLTSVTIPNSVTTIEWRAFSGCSGLTSVTIPNSVTTIESHAFSECIGLTSITIPNSVTNVGSSAFGHCSGLSTVYWNAENVIGYGTNTSSPFSGCSNLTTVVFGDSVGSIPAYVLTGCSGLNSLTIGNSVTTICEGAFYGCSGLTSLTIPNSVLNINDKVFWGCSGLSSLTLPNSVTNIGSDAFYGCSSLKAVYYQGNIEDWCSINFGNSYYNNPLYYAHRLYINNELVTDLVIPETVFTLNQYVFVGCSSLTSVTIPNTLVSIGDAAFEYCSGLKFLTLGSAVKDIKNYAFYGCSGLEAVYYQGDIETWCNIDFNDVNPNNPLFYAHRLYINNELVTNLVIPETVSTLKQTVFFGCSSLTSVTIPNSVTTIGVGAFRFCSGLTSVTIPNSVTTIGSSAFSGCIGLTSLTMGHSVTNIGGDAFAGCNNLISFTIPNSVTTLGEGVFDNCDKLNSIFVQWSNPITIEQYTFYGVDRNIQLFVPCGSQDYYRNAQYWSEFENIKESPHILSLSSNDKYGGDITVLKWADCEDNHCAILATPNIGYDFVGWYVNDELSTIEPSCDFSLTEDITFEARFERSASHNIANGTSNVWSNSDTWDLGVVPTSTSTVGIRKSIKVDVDATVSSLGIYDNSVLTVLSGVTLTITDTLGSTKASSIIIEDGGQLIHSSNGAMATIKQSIEPYTSDEDGWNLISYPMTGNGSISSVNNMLSNLYDLYYYDEPNERWVNSKDDNNSFTDLEAGKGYLYANIGMGVGAAAGSTVGDGSLTIGYTPYYTYYKYSISEIIFRVSELESAGLATAEMGALCWYATNETGYQQNNISIWMANVEDSELTSTSHNVTGMTLVYTGSMTPIIGWNEFVFNENNFTWDGTSNILICVQRNNGAWNSTINWQSHNPGFAAMSYKYNDDNAYDVTNETYSMTVSTTRPNTLFQTVEQIGHYASYEPITMSYAGQLANGTAEVTIPLSYTGGNTLSGFNLVGNPFVHNVTSYETTNVADGCFRVNDAKTNLIVSSISVANPLRPAEGFFVKATGNNASVTFNSQTRETDEAKGSIQLEIVQNDKLIDRFIVKEGVKLNKISLSGEHIEFYAKTNNQKYAIVPYNGKEQAVNFKTFKMGTFTINVKVENMDLSYLHLVDNFTGRDVDLLTTPSYTFNAASIDNESRFRLVFDPNLAVNNNDVFAYQYGDEIIVNGKGTLQVFDVLGRFVANYQIDGVESISNPSQKGVYMLRLLGDNLKTQKIVVK